MVPTVSYENGVATITTKTRQSMVHVAVVADLAMQGMIERTSRTEVLALSAGFLAMKAQRDQLQAELDAARAGQVGKGQAQDMQDARKVIADLRRAGDSFFEVYDQGDAPDSGLDNALRDTLREAENWLVRDVHAASVRAQVLKGGA
jgi:lambda repressor-like predicted transcriptional regulator